MREQLRRRTGIFACNDYAVISKVNVSLGYGNKGCGEVYTWVNNVPQVPVGQYGMNGATTSSWLNTYTFIMAWDTLMNSGKLWKHQWVVKVDPDAVFFPDRLRNRVRPFTGGSKFIFNCNSNGPKIYGALEVFSMEAISAYHDRVGACKNMNWHGWGEDMYMQECMKSVGAAGVTQFDLVADERCQNAACSDGSKAAFHAYKNVPAWKGCYEMAIHR